MKEDFDTWPQIDLFNEYLEATGDDRQKYKEAYGYDEAEWEAFQAGWNAAKKHFKAEELPESNALGEAPRRRRIPRLGTSM